MSLNELKVRELDPEIIVLWQKLHPYLASYFGYPKESKSEPEEPKPPSISKIDGKVKY